MKPNIILIANTIFIQLDNYNPFISTKEEYYDNPLYMVGSVGGSIYPEQRFTYNQLKARYGSDLIEVGSFLDLHDAYYNRK